jgi:hypothetical protein
MWTRLTAAPSIEAAFDSLREELEVDPDVLRRDLHDFIAELVGYGLATLQV